MSATPFLSSLLEDTDLVEEQALASLLAAEHPDAALTAVIELLGSQVVTHTLPAAPRFAEAMVARATHRREADRLDEAEDDAEVAVRTWGWLAGELDGIPQALAALAGLPTAGAANLAVAQALRATVEPPNETWLPGLVTALIERSHIEAAQGTPDLARVSAEAAQERAEWLVAEWSEDCRLQLAATLGVLAERDLEEGDDLSAADNYDEQASVFAAVEDRAEEGAALMRAGRILLDQHDLDGARTRLDLALNRLRESVTTDPSPWAGVLAEALEARGLCAMDDGDATTAAALSWEAAEAWGKLDLPGAKARCLSVRAECLTELGQREAALETAEAAAGLAQDLSEEVFSVEDRVWLFNALSRALADVGQRSAALRVAQEQVRLLRLQEAADPARAHPQLALSLVNLSIDLKHLGNPVEAVAAAREGVSRLRMLVAEEPLARADLASGLFELANCLGWVGKLEEALALVREASELWRSLDREQPGRFQADLASALSNEGGLWWQLGDAARAAGLMRGAADQLRTLTQDRPEQHGPALATVLTNLAGVLADQDSLPEALAAVEESVTVHRALHAQLPAAFASGLALALNNLGGTLFELDRYGAALDAFQEAERLLDGANGFQGVLAEVRSNQASSLVELSQFADALGLATRAVRALRRERDERPDAATPQLARALAVEGTAHLRTGDPATAVAQLAESLALLAPALRRRTAATSDLWEWVGDRYVEACATAGEEPDPGLLGGEGLA